MVRLENCQGELHISTEAVLGINNQVRRALSTEDTMEFAWEILQRWDRDKGISVTSGSSDTEEILKLKSN